ncbi:PaaI family thioesterase [Spirochaetota bacterium]
MDWKKYFKNDKFAAHNGIKLLEVRPGYAKAQVEIKEMHHNSLGMTHGGAIFTLADFAFSCSSNAHGNIAMAINVSISFLKATTKGMLFAESKEVSINPNLASYRVDVTDKKEDLIAIFHGMVYRKKEHLGRKGSK